MHIYERMHIGSIVSYVVKDLGYRVEHGNEKVTGLMTGFGSLDSLLGGLQPSDLIVVAGISKIGKTALALNIVDNIAVSSSKEHMMNFTI